MGGFGKVVNRCRDLDLDSWIDGLCWVILRFIMGRLVLKCRGKRCF